MGVGKKQRVRVYTRENWKEQQKMRSSPVTWGLLEGYTKRGKRIRARPKTLSFGLLDWPPGVFPL